MNINTNDNKYEYIRNDILKNIERSREISKMYLSERHITTQNFFKNDIMYNGSNITFYDKDNNQIEDLEIIRKYLDDGIKIYSTINGEKMNTFVPLDDINNYEVDIIGDKSLFKNLNDKKVHDKPKQNYKCKIDIDKTHDDNGNLIEKRITYNNLNDGSGLLKVYDYLDYYITYGMIRQYESNRLYMYNIVDDNFSYILKNDEGDIITIEDNKIRTVFKIRLDDLIEDDDITDISLVIIVYKIDNSISYTFDGSIVTIDNGRKVTDSITGKVVEYEYKNKKIKEKYVYY